MTGNSSTFGAPPSTSPMKIRHGRSFGAFHGISISTRPDVPRKCIRWKKAVCVPQVKLDCPEGNSRIAEASRSVLKYFKTDRLASAILEFPSGQSSFTCGTQTAFFQRMHFLGTSGRVEIEIPWNAPNDRPCRIFIGDVLGEAPKVEEFPVVDQYTIQGDEFSRAVRGQREVPVPLEDAIKNMAVIEAIFNAADSGKWERPEKI